jgi:nucleotide-binding universal stress UspA family protein
MKAKPGKEDGEVVLELSRRDEPLMAAGMNPEVKIKRILAPSDFSDCSRISLRYALSLARQHSAALDILHVVPSPVYGLGEYGLPDYAPLQKQLEEGSLRELREILAQEIPQGIPASALIRTGSAPQEIVEVAKSQGTDLIVISTHGHSGLKHVLLGSTAERVVRHASCPVLVVRQNEREFVSETNQPPG